METALEPSLNQTARYHLCREVILQPAGDETVLLSNVFTRTHVGTNADGLRLVGFFLTPRTGEEIEARLRDQSGKVVFWDRTHFSNIQGLMADPSNLVRDQGTADAPRPCGTASAILDLLSKRFILISDQQRYLNMFGKKLNIFDETHLGNFHQQLGRELRLKRRVDPDSWWLKQKFSEEGTDLRDNLYKFIQLHFWESMFRPAHVQGRRILDFGCGPGFYSRFLARRGASVLGVDPNPDFIRRAREQSLPHEQAVEYRVMEIGSGAPLEGLPSDHFDHIIFQDAFLFYFVPYQEKQPSDRSRVLQELNRVLKRGGSMWLIEPHGVFWLSPWFFGEAGRSFTVLTEYAEKQFGVAPSLSWISEALAEAGFLIRKISEPLPAPEAAAVDPHGYQFAKQFPLWWCFELVKG